MDRNTALCVLTALFLAFVGWMVWVAAVYGV